MRNVPQSIKAALKREDGNIDYKTRDQLFKQAIAEIDWSVGEILNTLKSQGIDENTLVLFTSDNGPAVGNAGPLKGRKGSTYEGGMREATVVRWPGHIPAGVSNDEMMTAMDLHPTFAKLAGAEMPTDRVIDGKDIWNTLLGKAKSPHKAFFYHRLNELQAVRSGEWKLRLQDGQIAELYNLKTDIGETENLLGVHPEIEHKLMAYIRDFEKELAANSRPAGLVYKPKALTQ